MKDLLFKHTARKNQRRRIAQRIKAVRLFYEGNNKKDALISLLQIASNYKKI